MEKEKIRPIYSEFQGYLSQAPNPASPNSAISDNSLWNLQNETIKSLSELTAEDYSRFSIQGVRKRGGGEIIYLSTYRQKLGGLISYLHGKYFSDEQAPFSGMPNTVISQTQEQAQSTSIQVYLDIQSQIDHALHDVEAGSQEQNFLEKFKSTLSTAKNVNEIFKLALQLAKEYGIGISTLLGFFS